MQKCEIKNGKIYRITTRSGANAIVKVVSSGGLGASCRVITCSDPSWIGYEIIMFYEEFVEEI